ncbi:MAG: S1C family serine protease [Deltaproteobacteria bacterium]
MRAKSLILLLAMLSAPASALAAQHLLPGHADGGTSRHGFGATKPSVAAMSQETPASAQLQAVNLKIRAALVTADLKVQPIPKLSLELRPVGAPAGAEPIRVTTSFEGTAEISLSAGSYLLNTPHPVDFEGKTYIWNFEITLEPPERSVELSRDNARVSQAAPRPGGETDLSVQFRQLQPCVMTVRSEIGHGTGFILDRSGLILTNQHVVGPSEYIAVQFDARRKVAAFMLASDPAKDVAVLWANLAAFPEACAVTIAEPKEGLPVVVEGERVFTIGSPLSQEKILTTGVVSKVEAHRIVSDVNINPGNSGGPLFNRAGQVVGITTFSEQASAGPGISGIVRIEEAADVLAQARAKVTGASPPAELLPVEPVETFPFEAAGQLPPNEKLDIRPYSFGAGNFEVMIFTPLLNFRADQEESRAAEKERQKRARKSGAEAAPMAVPEVKDWEKQSEEYKPVIHIRVSPKLGETGGSIFMSIMTRGTTPATLKFKTDFHHMRLLCGGKEIPPIHPGKIARQLNEHNYFVNVSDAAYQGFYVYGPEAISPSCGQVALEIYPQKDSSAPTTKILEAKTVTRVWSDFEPFRNSLSKAGNTDAAPK